MQWWIHISPSNGFINVHEVKVWIFLIQFQARSEGSTNGQRWQMTSSTSNHRLTFVKAMGLNLTSPTSSKNQLQGQVIAWVKKRKGKERFTSRLFPSNFEHMNKERELWGNKERQQQRQVREHVFELHKTEAPLDIKSTTFESKQINVCCSKFNNLCVAIHRSIWIPVISVERRACKWAIN